MKADGDAIFTDGFLARTSLAQWYFSSFSPRPFLLSLSKLPVVIFTFGHLVRSFVLHHPMTEGRREESRKDKKSLFL
jgi:hypothetical protein